MPYIPALSPRRTRALTLLELAAVTICLGILAIIGILSYQQVQINTQNTATQAEFDTMMRSAQALAKSESSPLIRQEHLDTAAAEMVASSSAPGVMAAPMAAGSEIILIEDDPQGTPTPGSVIGVDYGPALYAGYASYTVDLANLRTGVAMRSESGHCVLSLASGTATVDSWIVESDLGSACRGSNALAGFNPDASYSYEDPSTYAAPDQVTGLSFVSATATTATVSWTAVSNADASGYKVYVNDSYVSGPSLIAGTTYEITGLSPTSAYTVKVSAVDTDALEGSQSDSLTVLTVPATPTGLAATATSSSDITVSWNAQPYSTYRLYVNGAPLYSGSDTSYAFTIGTEATQYSFQIDATNTSGSSDISTAVYATTFPATPTGLAYVPGTSTESQIGLSWTESTGAVTGYRLYRDSTASDAVATIADPATTSWTDTGRSPGTSHTYYISAYNAGGESTPSSAVTGYTLSDTPVAPSTSNVSTTAMTVSWGEVTGASSYTLYLNSSAIGSFGSATTSYEASSLSPGVNYSWQLTATTPAGESAISTATTTPTRPAGITDLSVAAGSSSATLTWTQSDAAVLSGYKVYYKETAASSYTLADTISGLGTYTVTSLTPNVSHTFKVATYNASGETDSNTETASPYTSPAQPAAPTASGHTQSAITLTWTAPSSDGGSAITSYQLYRNSTDLVGAFGEATTSTTDSGLDAGTNYTYQVYACNIAGCSGASEALVTPTLPAAPSSVSLSPANTQIEVSWTDSASPVVSGHSVYYRAGTTGDFTEWTAGTADTSPTTITGLTNGTQYEVYVAATNGSGETASSTELGTPRTVPATPAAPIASDHTQSAITLTWTAPSSDGGSAITSYQLYRNSTDLVGAFGEATTSTTDSGLDAGTNYTYQVYACNIAGCSGISAPTLTPTVPAAPTSVSATEGYEEVVLSWTDSDSPVVSGHSVYYRAGTTGDFTEWNPGGYDTSPVTITGLTGQTLYTFIVKADNASGDAASTEVSATPYTIPGAPGTPTFVEATTSSITVSWTAPDDDGGSTVSSYEVVMNYGGASELSQSYGAATTDATFTGLDAGTNYSFVVRAQNGASWGPYGASATYPTLPDPPGSVTTGNGSILVDWTDSPSPVVTGYRILYKRANKGGSNALRANYTMVDMAQHASMERGSFMGRTSSQPRRARIMMEPPSFRSLLAGGSFALDGSPGASIAAAPVSMEKGATFSVRVVAYNSSGESPLVRDDGSSSGGTILNRTVPDDMSAPTLTAATTSALTVSWTAPSSDGGSAIESYEVYVNGGLIASPAAEDTSYTIGSLTAGQTYSIQMKACNIAGCSGASTALDATTRPAAATAVAGDVSTPNALDVSWTASTSSVVAGYKVYYRAGTTGDFTEWTAGTADTSPTTITGLTAGTLYSFRVDAYVDNGGVHYATPSSTPTAVTVIDRPLDPSAVSSSASSQTIALSWSPASSTTAQPVSGYRVYYKLATSSSYGAAAYEGTSTDYEITGLDNGSAYDVLVVAYNAVGESTVSEAQVSAAPYTTPDTPSISNMAAGAGAVSFTVTPGSNGGSSLTNYRVSLYSSATESGTYTLAEQRNVTPSGVAEVITLDSLTVASAGTYYAVEVEAENVAGYGPASARSAAVFVSDVPAAPAAPSVDYDSQQATGTWSAPSVNYGAAVSNYELAVFTTSTATSSPTGTCETASTTCTVTGLTNGETYYLRTRAQNSNGWGSYSDASSATVVCGVPGTPAATDTYARSSKGVYTTNGTGVIEVSVNTAATETNGCAIDDITATALTGAGATAGTCTGASGCNITGLNLGTAYTVNVTARNAKGSSASYSIGSLSIEGRPSSTLTWSSGTPAAGTNGDQYKNYTVSLSWSRATNGFTGTFASDAWSCSLASPATSEQTGSNTTSTTLTGSYTSNKVIASANGAANSSYTSRSCTLRTGYTMEGAYTSAGDYTDVAGSSTIYTEWSTSSNALPGYAYPYPYPSHYTGHYPSHYMGHYPRHYPRHYPSHYMGHYPSHYMGHYPRHYPGHYPSHYPRHYPGHYMGHYPRHYPSAYYNHYPPHYPRHYPRHYPGRYR